MNNKKTCGLAALFLLLTFLLALLGGSACAEEAAPLAGGCSWRRTGFRLTSAC